MKTCPKCKTKDIPMDANFCPHCGAQLKDGWFELVHHNDSVELRNDEEDEFIWITNRTNVYFDILIKNTFKGELFPQRTIKVPRITYGIIMARSGGGVKASLTIDENTAHSLIIVFDEKFKII